MRCFVIAEAGVNHNGSADLAIRLVEAAARAGADAVKFQTFRAERLVRAGAAKAAYQQTATGAGDQLSMLRGLELSVELHRTLVARCAELHIEFMSTPFDIESAEFLVGLGVRRIKIPSGELTHDPFLAQLAAFGLPLILSTGMSTLDEVKTAVAVIQKSRNRYGFTEPLEDMLTLLHCTSNYPALPADVNLRAMQTLRDECRLPVGYSDHTAGIQVAPLAAAMGAATIEKHLTLDCRMPGPDHAASLEPDEFVRMVSTLRETEIIMGSAVKAPTASELPIRVLVRRSVTLRRRVVAGQTLGKEDVELLRPGNGVPPAELDRVVGRKILTELPAGHTLQWSDLESERAMRKVIYVSGTRADFGLLRSTLQQIAAEPELSLSVCVTGTHLSNEFGTTVDEITQSNLRVCARLPVPLEHHTGGNMVRAIGHQLLGMADVFERERPDLVLVLGDRGEMLAAALAAIHLNIPVAHIHGGERSGTVDEPVRHAISKLAHYHFVSTTGARRRLIRMGEPATQVFVTGAPGLDSLHLSPHRSRADLCEEQGFDSTHPLALVLFHPVLQEANDAARQMRELLDAALALRLQALVLEPNADAGGSAIRAVLSKYQKHPSLRVHAHLLRTDFVAWMAAVDVMAGNSSSGIIEAASFGLPVVNVGSRQICRERSRNVIDVPARRAAIVRGLHQALTRKRLRVKNIYGDGQAGERITELLKRLPLTLGLMQKSNAY